MVIMASPSALMGSVGESLACVHRCGQGCHRRVASKKC